MIGWRSAHDADFISILVHIICFGYMIGTAIWDIIKTRKATAGVGGRGRRRRFHRIMIFRIWLSLYRGPIRLLSRILQCLIIIRRQVACELLEWMVVSTP